MLRVEFHQSVRTLTAVLTGLGFGSDRAGHCARLFVEASCDGIYSHGLHRFPRFVRTIRNGTVDVHASPELVGSYGALERWNGNRGPGNLSAHHAMARAVTLAQEHGVGCVALANTNHWMRGGTYGWLAANAGALAICWTNTLANLPPWGLSVPLLGNNPLVIAAPRPAGHVVVDTAMSQFSYGALESYALRGEPLPVEGGFSRDGYLTRDAAEILRSGRPLPIGIWKGSGLALLLDLAAGILAGGLFTKDIPNDPNREGGQSQIFLAFDGHRFNSESLADSVIESLRTQAHAQGQEFRYPGERVLAARTENLANGVPVDAEVWSEILQM